MVARSCCSRVWASGKVSCARAWELGRRTNGEVDIEVTIGVRGEGSEGLTPICTDDTDFKCDKAAWVGWLCSSGYRFVDFCVFDRCFRCRSVLSFLDL